MNCFKEGIEDLHRKGIAGAGVAIGHLDTGIDGQHSGFDLSRITFQQFGYRGMVCPTDGIVDSRWHGTHTAGLLVGRDPSIGIAPDAHLYSGAVLEEGHVIARILSGLDWLLETPVRVVNLSLGLLGTSPVLQSLIGKMVKKDIIVVAPIGNRGAGQTCVPGCYPTCLSVGATGQMGLVAAFSGSVNAPGSTECLKPDVLAPGVDILSFMPGGEVAAKTGTSAASAEVSGLCAVLRGAFPKASASAVKSALIVSCEPRSGDQLHRSTAGLVNPMGAYQRLAQTCSQRSVAGDRPPQTVGAPPSTGRYIDPRLKKVFSSTTPHGTCEAIFEFDSWQHLTQYRQRWQSEPSATLGELSLSVLKHCPIVICQGPRHQLEALSQVPAIRVASACDVDRLA